MADQHSKRTIIALAVLASALTSLLHEGVGHGVTAWLRGDGVTQLTSSHLDAVRSDRLVDAGGTLVNLAAGFLALLGARLSGPRANLRYFFWILAAMNLLLGAGYFLFSGVLGLGDWGQFIHGIPQQGLLRTFMAIMGAALYLLFVRMLAIAVRPFVPLRRAYNAVGRLPYVAACLYMGVVGAFDPLGVRLLLISTIPAFLGGLSGLLWADSLLPNWVAEQPLVVRRSTVLWLSAAVIGGVFLAVVGRGIHFAH